MLSDVNLRLRGSTAVVTAVARRGEDSRLERGMYLSSHWNFEHTVVAPCLDIHPNLPAGLSPCGVCDSPEQWVERYRPVVDDAERHFSVSFVRLNKADEPPSGGWRWRMLGPYIGAQSPKCEYLRDEPVVETVYTFRVYEHVGVENAMTLYQAEKNCIELIKQYNCIPERVSFKLQGPGGTVKCRWADPHFGMFRITDTVDADDEVKSPGKLIMIRQLDGMSVRVVDQTFEPPSDPSVCAEVHES